MTLSSSKVTETRPPISVQKALFAVLGPLARALGYQPQYGVSTRLMADVAAQEK